MDRRRWILLGLALVGVVWFVRGGGQPSGPRQRAIVAYTAKWCGKCQLDKPRLAELRVQGWSVQEIDIDAAGLTITVPWYVVTQNGATIETENLRAIQ